MEATGNVIPTHVYADGTHEIDRELVSIICTAYCSQHISDNGLMRSTDKLTSDRTNRTHDKTQHTNRTQSNEAQQQTQQQTQCLKQGCTCQTIAAPKSQKKQPQQRITNNALFVSRCIIRGIAFMKKKTVFFKASK